MSEKSRKIIASIVNMAKSIGISTQAEGVETEENLEFLKEIGCERAQGYLVSKPQPLHDLLHFLKERGYTYEPENRQAFYNHVGVVNLLSARPLALDGSKTAEEMFQSDIAVCVMDVSGWKYRKILSNGRFDQLLQAVGINTEEDFEIAVNNPGSRYFNSFREFVLKMAEAGGEIQQMDFLHNEYMISIHGRLLSRTGGYQAALLTVVAQEVVEKKGRIRQLNDALLRITMIYDCVDYLDIREDTTESIINTGQYDRGYDGRSLREHIMHFAMEQVHPEDRSRYFAMYELDTLPERIDASPVGMISDCIRIRQMDGSYDWRLFMLISVSDKDKDHYIQYIQYTGQDDLERMTGERSDEHRHFQTEEQQTHFHNLLVHNLLHDVDIGMFWKDRDRRFMAVNDAFMDYYGFRSIDEVIGKTDEEMGWHVNPDPYMHDEWQVIREGKTIKFAPGTCISHGMVREIAAFKMPLYEKNKVVGLVGFFVDMTGEKRRMEILKQSEYQDTVTGALNISGLMRSALQYRDSYLLRDMDFALMILRIADYSRLKEEYGLDEAHEFARKTYGILSSHIGVRGSIGYLGVGDFAVMMQVDSRRDAEDMMAEICEEAGKVTDLEGIFWTLYMKSVCILRSETDSLEKMYEEAMRLIY